MPSSTASRLAPPFEEHVCTAPDQLRDKRREFLTALTGSCPEMTALTGHIRTFADLLKPAADNGRRLHEWSPAPAKTTSPNRTPSPAA